MVLESRQQICFYRRACTRCASDLVGLIALGVGVPVEPFCLRRERRKGLGV